MPRINKISVLFFTSGFVCFGKFDSLQKKKKTGKTWQPSAKFMARYASMRLNRGGSDNRIELGCKLHFMIFKLKFKYKKKEKDIALPFYSEEGGCVG